MCEIQPPPVGTEAHTWWMQGAAWEATARIEGLSPHVREARDCLESLARLGATSDQAGTVRLLTAVARIYCAGQPFRVRLRAALRLVRR